MSLIDRPSNSSFSTCIAARLQVLGMIIITMSALISSSRALALDPSTRVLFIKSVDSTLHLMYFDSSSAKKVLTKSAIVEFHDFIALIEVPVVYDGGGAQNMREHTEEAEMVLSALRERFPTKPLKYVLCSHWHPHSMSAVTPFISKGIVVVTTRRNIERISSTLDSTLLERYRENLCFVDGDSVVIQDEVNRIVAYRLEKSRFSFLPTDDYLFFDLPKSDALFSSCMYQRFKNMSMRSREFVSGRTEDVQRFLNLHQMHPSKLLSFMVFDDETDGTISADTMRKVLAQGSSSYAVIDSLKALSENDVRLHSDSLRDEMLRNQVPLSYLNTAIYQLLAEGRVRSALALAELQGLSSPANANSWDTYGQVLYYLGNTKSAKYYERQCLRIDSTFIHAGEKAWKLDLEKQRLLWKEQGIRPDIE